MRFLATFVCCLAIACLVGWALHVPGCDVATVVGFVIAELLLPEPRPEQSKEHP